MGVFIYLIYFTFLMWVIKKIPIAFNVSLSVLFLRFAFALKIGGAFFIYLVYQYFYAENGRVNSDIFKYFDDGGILFEALINKPMDFFHMFFGINDHYLYYEEQYFNHMNHWYRPWERTYFNDNRTMIRINAVFYLFSGGNFHVHQLFSSFFAFLGLVGVYSFFEPALGHKKIAALLLFGMPSVLIWGSGLFKETFGIGLMGLCFWAAKHLASNEKPMKYGAIFLICIAFWLFLKAYALFLLIPFLLVFIGVGRCYFSLKGYGVALGVLVVIFIGSDFLAPTLSLPRMFFKKQQDFLNVIEEIGAGSTLNVSLLRWDYLSYLEAAPRALFNVVVHKMPWNARHALELFSIVEAHAILLLSLLLIFYKKSTLQHKNYLLLCVCYVLPLYLLIGYTTPVLGAIVRYKIIGLPVLVLGIFVLGKVPFIERLEQRRFFKWV